MVVLGTLSYVGTLHYIYAEHIAPQFAYLQYAYRSPDPGNYGIVVGIVVVLALSLPRRLTHPSHFIVLGPVHRHGGAHADRLAVRARSRHERVFRARLVGRRFLSAHRATGHRQPLRGFLPQVVVRRETFWAAIAAIFVALNLYVVLSVGVNLDLPSINDVYGVRDEFRQESTPYPALDYVTPLLAMVVNPFMMVRGLWDRRWLWFAAGIFGRAGTYTPKRVQDWPSVPGRADDRVSPLRRPRPAAASAALFAAPILAASNAGGGPVDRLERRTSLMVPAAVTPG